jgi:hypothetical protein
MSYIFLKNIQNKHETILISNLKTVSEERMEKDKMENNMKECISIMEQKVKL